jgi:hypothetical protein
MIKKYIAYLQDNPQGFWFKRKLYGWGWVPATWQGWSVIVAYVMSILALAFTVDNNLSMQEVILPFVLPALLLTLLLILICYKKGEKPRWQWGTKK